MLGVSEVRGMGCCRIEHQERQQIYLQYFGKTDSTFILSIYNIKQNHKIDNNPQSMRLKNKVAFNLYLANLCLGSFIVGYLLTFFYHFQSLYAYHNDFLDEAQFRSSFIDVNSILLIGAAFGIGFYQYFASKWGYWQIFCAADLGIIIASFIGMIYLGTGIQRVSRFMMGIAAGINMIGVPSHLSSNLPSHLNHLVGLHQLAISFGCLLGTLVGFSVVDGQNWRQIKLIPIIISLIRLYSTSQVFRFNCLSQMLNKDGNQLQKYLQYFYEPESQSQFISQKRKQHTILFQFNHSSSFFYRMLTVIVMVTLFFFCGYQLIYLWAYYLIFPRVFGWSAGDVLMGSSLLFGVNILGILWVINSVKTVGQKYYLSMGMKAMAISLILLGFSQTASSSPYIQLLLILIYTISFSVSLLSMIFPLLTVILCDLKYPLILFCLLLYFLQSYIAIFTIYFGITVQLWFYAFVCMLGVCFVDKLVVEQKGKAKGDLYKQYTKEGDVIEVQLIERRNYQS